MSSTTCNPCDSFSCACSIFECLGTLRLGRITALNTQVYVHIKKQNGAEYIQVVRSDASGFVDLDLTEPDPAFYNHFDGTYIIFLMNAGYFCDGDKLSVIAPGGTYTDVGVQFKPNGGVVYNTQHIQLL